uniref:Uncharacterized protein n=1 Tax=Corethron hystrix TaxID=216773 RepID=A0A7S1BHT0_9STRA|mmetsp:Transcript_26221/g.60282  ORF Transcript_26221/g.60282 Transcript_26221/m.60282 type:complete len:124 (+) Transcript_26221:1627-1998(+)
MCNTPLTVMTSLQDSCSIKNLYGMGYSTPAIDDSTSLDNKFLALHGKGNNTIGPPELAISPHTCTKPGHLKLNRHTGSRSPHHQRKKKKLGPVPVPTKKLRPKTNNNLVQSSSNPRITYPGRP